MENNSFPCYKQATTSKIAKIKVKLNNKKSENVRGIQKRLGRSRQLTSKLIHFIKRFVYEISKRLYEAYTEQNWII